MTRAAIRVAALLCLAVCTPSVRADAGLAAAIRADDLNAVRAALAAGADVEAPSNELRPLALAAIRGDLEMMDLLLAAGADPDAISLGHGNALSMAVRSCHAGLDIIKALVAAKANLEDRSGVGITPLLLAIQEKRVDVALWLLDAGADVNALGPFGDGVLNYAIYVKEPVLIGAAMAHGVHTDQLGVLLTTVDYDSPGIADARSHHEVLCDFRS